MANPWDELSENLRRFGQVSAPQKLYDDAVKSGVKEPGRSSSYQLPATYSPHGVRLMTPEEVDRSGTMLAKGLAADGVHQAYAKSFDDPNHYITQVTPEEYLQRIYGEAWRAQVKPSAILSQSRPESALAPIQGMSLVNPTTTQDLLTRRVHVIRGPGLGYQRPGINRHTLAFLTPQGKWGNTIVVPRAVHDMFGSGHHEMRHVLDRGMPSNLAGQPFFEGKPGSTIDPYQNRFVEVKANAGMLKAQQFQKSGALIKNTADAREFLEGLLDERIRPMDPDPIAQAGERKGLPIQGYNALRWGVQGMLKKANPEDLKKYVSLLPKVFGVAAPVATGAAAATSSSGGQR